MSWRRIGPWPLLLAALATACAVDPPQPPPGLALDPEVAAAVEQGRAAVTERPRDAERWLHLGMIYEANRLDNLALPCYERGVALAARSARGWYRLAQVRARLGDA
ncbi:MAG TPA: hypothetical protein VJS92_13140, partial [Candidatus Polarisedimenticolaceae bacterium]|nr:hypothetical protein [Candidatus Polarisedimenticolaceae bacterium]